MSTTYAHVGSEFENAHGERVQVKSIFVVKKEYVLDTVVQFYYWDSKDARRRFKSVSVNSFERFMNKKKMFRAEDLNNLATGKV